MKHLTKKIGSGKTPAGGANVYVPSGIVFLRSQNIHSDGLRLDDVVYLHETTDEEMLGTRVLPDDLLMNITGASLGRCTITPPGLGKANVNQHVCIIRLDKKEILPKFAHAYLCSAHGQAQIFSTENGISRDALNFEQLGDLWMSVPPMVEQDRIVAYLDAETARLDALAAKVRRGIELLRERRLALITEVVLGQRRVTPEMVAGLPAEAAA